MHDLHLKLRGEPVRLGFPVAHYRQRTDDQMWSMGTVAAHSPQRALENMGQRGRRLSQSHIVRKATAEAETPQKLQPAECSPLIWAQFALEPGRLLSFCQLIIGQAGDEISDPALRGEVVVAGWTQMSNGLSE